MGTAELACPSLVALSEWEGSDIVTVVTQPDRPKGRKLQLQPSYVKQCAEKLGLPLQQPETLRNNVAFDALAVLKPDLIVVAAYGQILPSAVLDLPPHGCLNVNASILDSKFSPIPSAVPETHIPLSVRDFQVLIPLVQIIIDL